LPVPPKFLMASCSDDKSMRVWDPWTGGAALRQIGGCIDHALNVVSKVGHEGKVLCLTHLPVHGMIATGGADKVIIMWKLPEGYCGSSGAGGGKAKRGRGGSSSGSGSGGGAGGGGKQKKTPLFDYPLAQHLPEEDRPISVADSKPAHLPRGHVNTLAKHEFESACFVAKLEGHRDWVRCIVAVPNHGCADMRNPHRREYMASGSDDKSVFLWDFSSTPPERVRKLRQHTDAISCLAVLPPTREYIPVPPKILGGDPTHVGEFSFIYRYISRESCSQFDSLPLTSLTIEAPFKPGCRQLLLASGAHDGSVRVWDLLSGKHIRDYRVGIGGISRAWVMTLAVYPTRLKGETLIVSGHEDKTIRMWSLENPWSSDRPNGEAVRTIPNQHSEVDTLTMLPGGLIATGSADGTLRIIA